jgi:hypothetical protein
VLSHRIHWISHIAGAVNLLVDSFDIVFWFWEVNLATGISNYKHCWMAAAISKTARTDITPKLRDGSPTSKVVFFPACHSKKTPRGCAWVKSKKKGCLQHVWEWGACDPLPYPFPNTDIHNRFFFINKKNLTRLPTN